MKAREAAGIGYGLVVHQGVNGDECLLGINLEQVARVNGAISNSATALVVDATDTVNVGDRLVIGSEIILVTERNTKGTGLTVVRAAHGTAGVAIANDARSTSTRWKPSDYLGISLSDPHRLSDVYAQGDMVGVISQGTIFLEVATAVAVGDPVTADASTGVIAGDDPTTSKIPIPNARWVEGAAASGIALAQLGQNN